MGLFESDSGGRYLSLPLGWSRLHAGHQSLSLLARNRAAAIANPSDDADLENLAAICRRDAGVAEVL